MKKHVPLLAGLFVAALLLRLVLLTYYEVREPKTGNALQQVGSEEGSIAASIARGSGFSSPFPGQETGPTSWTAPVYPFLLAADFYLFGVKSPESIAFARLLNCVFAALTTVVVFQLTRSAFGFRTGVVAGSVWAVWPFSLQIIQFVWDHTVSALLLAFWMYLVSQLGTKSPLSRWAVLGLVGGVLILTNPACLTSVALGLSYLLIAKDLSGKYPVKGVAITLLLLTVTVAPWIVRNYLIFDRVIFLKSNFFLELSIGNNPRATGRFHGQPHPYENSAELAKYRALGEVQYMESKKEEALGFIRENPGKFLQLTLKRFVMWWTDPWPGREASLVAYGKFLLGTGLSLLTAVGAWHAAKKPGMARLLVAAVIFFPAPYYITHISPHYRHTVEPLMIALASHALDIVFGKPASSLMERLRSRS